MRKKLVVFGNTNYAEMVCDYFTDYSDYDVVAFTVDSAYVSSDQFYGRPLVDFTDIEKVYSPNDYDMFVAVGSAQLNHLRERICNQAKAKGYRLATFVHPNAYVARDVSIGENCILMECCRVLTRTKICDNVIIWPTGFVSHNCIVGNNCYIVGSVNGFVDVGDNCFLGAGAMIADGVHIAKDNFIAMGAVVRKDTEQDSLYDGYPATKHPRITASMFAKLNKKY